MADASAGPRATKHAPEEEVGLIWAAVLGVASLLPRCHMRRLDPDCQRQHANESSPDRLARLYRDPSGESGWKASAAELMQ